MGTNPNIPPFQYSKKMILLRVNDESRAAKITKTTPKDEFDLKIQLNSDCKHISIWQPHLN